MEHLYLTYNSQLCIKNKFTQKFVGLETSTQILSADYPPASIEVKDQLKSEKIERSNYTLKIKIVSRELEKSEFILQGSKVHLINTQTDEYITCSSTGEIKFDKKSNISEEVNKHLYKASTWTIQFLKNQNKINQSEKELIRIYDQLCLKSVHSTYLTLKSGSLELIAEKQMNERFSTWSLSKANFPQINQWVFSRNPFKKFCKIQIISQNQNSNQIIRQKKLLKMFPPQKQQVLLMQDLFDVMLGYDGVYIKKDKKFNLFLIEPHMEQPTCTLAFKQLTQKILVMPVLYFRIQTYVNTYSMQEGIICQALCGGLRRMLKEYKMMICQFNKQSLEVGMTLQKLWYLIQSPIKIMQALDLLVADSQKCRGGQIITALSKLLNESTDQQIIQIYNNLFFDVVKIYIRMLSRWLYQGVVQDKFGQFMIKTEQKSLNKQWSYWQQKFLIRQQMVPSIFAKQVNEILVIGKYLNILKACGKISQNPHQQDIYLHFQKFVSLQNFSEPILKAYQWTNKQMLELVFQNCKFNDVLKSIKGYFFLEYGDLFVHLMDAAQEDLIMLKKKSLNQTQKSKLFSEQKIQNLFDLLIRTSSANNDPFKDQVTIRVQNTSIYDQVHRLKTLEPEKLKYDYIQKPFVKKDSKYIDFMTLEYKCQFPLSLIFNKKSMSKYQVLFRFLFWCKFIERQLSNVWQSLQQTKKTFLPFFTPAYLVNQRMINFIKNFIYYLCYEVIEQNWLVFTQNLQKVKSFQDIIDCHTNFLNKCLVESLLSNSKLLAIITSQVGKACQNFVDVRNLIDKCLTEFNFEPIPINPKTGSIISQRKIFIEQMKSQIQENLKEQDFKSIVQSYGSQFDDSMRKLLKEIYQMYFNNHIDRIGKQQSHLLTLINRLDEERFFSKRLFGNLLVQKQ